MFACTRLKMLNFPEAQQSVNYPAAKDTQQHIEKIVHVETAAAQEAERKHEHQD